ncbi:MAG: hypothetical protein HY763_02275 [Planctomycetes bacterium]|nr:hypothetical protein [Planctomycetota bacterium]
MPLAVGHEKSSCTRNHKWVYDYPVEKEGGVTRHFRLNVFTQTQPLLSNEEHDS